MSNKEKFNKKLLVEGNDDQHVIWSLCERFNIPETFDVINCDGINHIFEQIPVRFKQYGIETVGIIIDADTDIKKRWNSISSILSAQGYSVPINLPSNGLIIENNNNIKVGVWIMPNNYINGMLEDFISFLVPEDDKLLPIIHETLLDVEEQGLNLYSMNHKSKAIIHSWLALQEEPGTPLGLGITKRYLSTEQKICLKLINWLIALFKETDKNA